MKPTTPRMALMGQRGRNKGGKGKKKGTEELEVQQVQKNKAMKNNEESGLNIF